MKENLDIVFIVLDTQRADRLSCYGYPLETSPNLDGLANLGCRFLHAVAPAQWTIPTHASMFTGLYPSEHMMLQMESILPNNLETLAERLKRAGYFTAGYSHNPLVGKVNNELSRGFNTFTNYNYLGAGLLSARLNELDARANWLARMRITPRFLMAELLGFSQQTSLHVLSPFVQPVWQKVTAVIGGSKIANVAQSLTAVSHLLIDRPGLEENQPIFAFINLMGTHVPYAPSMQILSRFLPRTVGKQNALQMLQKTNNWQIDVRNWLDMGMPVEEYQAVLDSVYNAEVAEQDAHIGQFLTRLRSAGNFKRTYFVVVADHGDHLGEKQRLNHAFGISGQLTHVPLIIYDPTEAVPHEAKVTDIVSTRRIFHTLLTSAGAATPKERMFALVEVGKTGNNPQETVVFSEGYPLQWAIQRLERYRPGLVESHGYHQLARAVYADAYKLIVMGQQQELYHVRQDTAETTNLSKRFPERVNQMQRQLNEFEQQMKSTKSESLLLDAEDKDLLKHLRSLGYLG